MIPRQIRIALEGSRSFINLVVILFFLGALLGWFGYPLFEERVDEFIKKIYAGVIVEDDFWGTVKNIFLRNASTTIILVASGILIFPAILIIGGNGLVVGIVARHANKNGIELGRILISLIPHGVFELPALFISAGLGMNIGWSILHPEGQSRVKTGIKALKYGLLAFITVVIPLLVLAAFLEMAVSKNLIM